MIDPLTIWKSEKVRDLLKEFFVANFEKAGVDKSFAEEMIDSAWKARSSKILEEDRVKINNIYLKAKDLAKYPQTETNTIEFFDLSSVKTFLDVGANKLATINHIQMRYPDIEMFYAIDVIPKVNNFFDESRGKYIQIDPEIQDWQIPENSIDLINIQFVLHHFENEEAIIKTLENCRKVLKSGGRIILWEEAFEDSVDEENLSSTNKKLGIDTDENLTKKFYELTEDERWQFIIANDWIINVAIPHMQWTGLYKEWKDWVSLFESQGFKLNKYHNLGLRINARLKQGVHILGEFEGAPSV